MTEANTYRIPMKEDLKLGAILKHQDSGMRYVVQSVTEDEILVTMLVRIERPQDFYYLGNTQDALETSNSEDYDIETSELFSLVRS